VAYIFVSLLECGKHKEIIDWSLDGTSFFVFNQEAMTRKILPVVYAQTHFSSFERQLNVSSLH
jgi:heat shock transcription factor